MKVGDLVKVRSKFGGYKNGIVLEVKQDDYNFVTIVQPSDGSRQLYAHPTDLEVLNESR
jgi:hypothetical protein|tara:strand:+ start:387 stop:563 length:177 start_codon:yes stop_codon:yes gene_type:complete